MTIFTEILSVWRKEDLLSEAWEQSLDMLDLSHNMFIKAVKKSKKQENLSVLKQLKNRDKEINKYQREVRRKIITHFSLQNNFNDISNIMVLMNMIVDIERIGDYSKNILDLAIYYPEKLNTKTLHPELHEIEQVVKLRFDKTVDAIKTEDVELASKLIKGFKKQVTTASDRIVNNIISGELNIKSGSESAAIVLYARYLKRIGSHLKNITTTIINPIDSIGYQS
ncbi:MAG: PhoU domain-containing protein [Candidatus Marinimicrobia bacterium]|jgi:phosphate uptake regulator|nr:PhoU domain-containing protein [Candidatus Neomarinimicrobiota bacterium]|tara:strand:- start:5622 stop:6296 length:675 start_codon:yes stop_codon:yes gene_type:complete